VIDHRFAARLGPALLVAATLLLHVNVSVGADRTGKPVPIPPIASVARSGFGMAATGSPEATEAAVKILEQGGNAIDAAVAAAIMLGVSDPDASGIGGMTYMVIHLAGGRTTVLDGTAPTPFAVDPATLQALDEANDLFGYEMVAVPTTLAVLERARSRYGTLSMADLLGPSIEVAESGYRLSPIQIVWSNVYYEHLMTTGYLRFLAFADGETLGQVGDIVCRPDLARTLRQLARDGISSFYRGQIGNQIHADMIQNGGFVRKSDLSRLRIKEVTPLRTTYRGHEVLTVPRPGGGTPVIEALNILEVFPSKFLAEDSLGRHQTLIEAFKIALADRVLAPQSSFRPAVHSSPAITKEHARRRAEMIQPGTIIPVSDLVGPVDPECVETGESTTHVSVADRRGNVVSLTQTLGRSYGAEVATPGLGFPYNSMLENFNFDKPHCPGKRTVSQRHGAIHRPIAGRHTPGCTRGTELESDLRDRHKCDQQSGGPGDGSRRGHRFPKGPLWGIQAEHRAVHRDPRSDHGRRCRCHRGDGIFHARTLSVPSRIAQVCPVWRRQRCRLGRRKFDLCRCRRQPAMGFGKRPWCCGRERPQELKPLGLWKNTPAMKLDSFVCRE
jgi:gamma-glutamyltranspeptidase/glutathione hydrolase